MATTFQIQVSTVANFATTVHDESGLASPSVQVAGLAYSTLHYWRVRTTTDGETSEWSSVFSFTTLNAPDAPTLSTPADGTTDAPITQTVTWLSSATAASYGLQIDDDPGFGSPLVNVTGITNLYYINSGLATNTTYYWRVNATNTAGTSAWSSSWSFSTVNIPAARTLVYPGNGTTVTNQPIVFAWSA